MGKEEKVGSFPWKRAQVCLKLQKQRLQLLKKETSGFAGGGGRGEEERPCPLKFENANSLEGRGSELRVLLPCSGH